MKNLKKILASVLAVSMVASFASVSASAAVGDTELGRGTVLYEEDFETAEEVADASLTLNRSGNNASITLATEDVTNSGRGQMLRTYQSSTDTRWAFAQLDVSKIEKGDNAGKGVYLVEYDFYTDAGSTIVGFETDPYISTKAGILDWYTNVSNTGVMSLGRGGSTTKDGANAATISLNTWYRMSYIADIANDKVYFYINGKFQSAKNMVSASGTVNPADTITAFGFGNYGTKVTNNYFDNIKITKLDTTDKLNILGFSLAADASTDSGVNKGTAYTTLTDARTDADTVYATLNLYNGTDGEKTPEFTYIAAAYAGDVLVAVESKTPEKAVASLGSASLSFELGSALLASNVTEVKFFAWDGLGTMIPVAETVSFK